MFDRGHTYSVVALTVGMAFFAVKMDPALAATMASNVESATEKTEKAVAETPFIQLAQARRGGGRAHRGGGHSRPAAAHRPARARPPVSHRPAKPRAPVAARPARPRPPVAHHAPARSRPTVAHRPPPRARPPVGRPGRPWGANWSARSWRGSSYYWRPSAGWFIVGVGAMTAAALTSSAYYYDGCQPQQQLVCRTCWPDDVTGEFECTSEERCRDVWVCP